MPLIPFEVEQKRLQLQIDLYKLLNEYSDGILKINLWSLLTPRTKLKLTNGEFRVGSMDAALKLFKDMVYEHNRDGKIFICLKKTFSPTKLGLEDTRNQARSQQMFVATPLQEATPPNLHDSSQWPALGGHAMPSTMASDAFLAQQITAATRGMSLPSTSGHQSPHVRMPGIRTLPPSLPPAPVIQAEVLSSSSEDDSSEPEEMEANLGQRTVATSLVKMRLVDLLRENGPLKQGKILGLYARKYGGGLAQHSGMGFQNLMRKFSDVFEKIKMNNSKGTNKYGLKKSFLESTSQSLQWGQGAVKSEPITIGIGEGQETVIDLTEESQPSKGDLSSDFLSFEVQGTPKPSTSKQVVGYPGNTHVPKQVVSHPGNTQVSKQRGSYVAGDLLPNEAAPYETSHVIAKPISKKKFEEKELHVAPIRRANPYAKPTKDQLDNAAQECIEIIAESNSYVSCERIEKLLIQRFQVGHMNHLGVRYVDQIETVNVHNRLMAKVTAYVHAFVKVRSICTLYELKECLKEFAPGKSDFNKLHIGPLQRMPVIYQMFKFPTDMEEIPEITTMDVLEHLRNYLTEKQMWMARVDLEDFMEYLVDKYEADNAFQLGVRIRSLVLGVQVLKKAQRDIGSTRRSLIEGFKENLRKDIENVFQKFKMTVMHTSSDGQWEVRNHYLKLSPEIAIMEIFQKFNLIMSIVLDSSQSNKQRKQQNKTKVVVDNFLLLIRDSVLTRNLFHLAICVSNSVLEESALELLAPPEKETIIDITTQDKVKPPKGAIIADVEKYLKRCLQHGTLNLSLLDKIEDKIAEDHNSSSFAELGYGRFLQFILQEAKKLLEECGGTSVGAGSSSGEVDSGFKPSYTDILSFIHQCLQCGRKLDDEIDSALSYQFHVKEGKQLGYGKTANLITAAQKPGQHQYQEHSVVFEVAMGTEIRKSYDSKVGMLGHQKKEAALACLHNCPMLEDMATWSHWSLVFEPEFGKLKDFVQKYGGTSSIPVQGGKQVFTYHIAAMETRPGVLLKLTTMTSTELFEEALIARNPRNVCGQLLSLIVANKGMKNSPLALLANQMKSHLFTIHASDSTEGLPGAPPSESSSEAVKFVLRCLVILPIKSCISVANQIFLEPLGQVVGSSKSKHLLLSVCETAEESSRLQELGCMLGVGEWTNQILQKCHMMMTDMEVVPEDDLMMNDREEEPDLIVLDDDEDDGHDKDSDSTSVTSSHCSIFSDDDDIQIISVEGGTKIKAEVKEEPRVEEEPTDQSSNNAAVTEIKVDEEGEQTAVTIETTDTAEGAPESDSDMEIMTEEERQQKECEKVINNIRRSEFGIGIELNEDGQRLKKVQDERLGRSLDRLSKDLYSKDTHFVLELIQNADDNDYPEFLSRNNIIASVKFVMQSDGVIVLNNENGFLEKNIRAICDVGRSTKGKHKFGYIGQKGIGFKSVFRVTDRPEVHSNGYHICFDVQSGPMGYILPHWIEDEWETEPGWTTKIVLPLKDEMKVHTRSLAARFNDIHPSLLLFLHRLRQITIDNKVENTVQVMTRRDLGDRVVEIEHNNGIDRWLVVKKMLDASKISLQAKSGVDVESTEIALAFPLTSQSLLSKVMPPKQPVFAFLPLRSYGFRFIIQADFDVPSSREDVDRDSAWNQWIRNEIHKLFLEALDVFKNHREFKGMMALINFLQFIPIEDEILDFFRPVSTQILKQFRARPCLPTQPNSKGLISWKLPNQVVTVKDSLVREVVTPDFLQKHLDLFYLHREVADFLNPTLTQCLGIESLTTKHLLLIGQAIISLSPEELDPSTRLMTLTKWLACVYRSLDEFHDNQDIYTDLRKMKIIPLASREYVCLEDNIVFFPLSQDQLAKAGSRDPLTILQEDMNTIHPWFLASPDNEVNSQNHKLLYKLSVRTLSPSDVIQHHILPILKSDQWKSKSRDVLISYLVYIKDQVEKDSSLVNMDELAEVAVVMTNQGEKNPKRDNIHFTPVYGNKHNLQEKFPGYDWCLLDSVYIQNLANNLDKQKWHRFFSRLGVTDFITVRPQKIELDSSTVKDSAWSSLEQLYPDDFKEGCVVEDYNCDEMRDLLRSNKAPESFLNQMTLLCEVLDQVWDSQFAKFTKTKLIRKDNQQEREVDSSFSIWLREVDWLPAIEVTVSLEKNNIVKYREEITRRVPSSLYYPCPDIVKMLYYTVTYVNLEFNISASTFAKFLGLKFQVSIDDLLNSLKGWGQRSDPSVPSFFVSSHDHIQKIYMYLSENLTRKQIQDLFDKDPIMFVPVKVAGYDYGNMEGSRFKVEVAGQMLSRQEVWWEDRTGLFVKYTDTLQEIHADIGNKKILSQYHVYKQSRELMEFFNIGRVEESPTVEEYAELLIHVAGSQSHVEPRILHDVFIIFSKIGELMKVEENDPEKETKTLLCESWQKNMLKIFEKQAIIPSKRKTWVSMETKPLFADNKEYENIFTSNANVHFVLLEDVTQKRQNYNKGYQIRHEALMSVLRMCGLEDLSAVVEEDVILDMFIPCPKLQGYMCQCVPLLQKFLFNNYRAVYERLKEAGIGQTMMKLQCIETNKLEVRYWFRNREDIYDIRPETCMFKNDQFIFHKEAVESYGEINKEIARVFSNNDNHCFRELRNFLTDVQTCLTHKYENLDRCVYRYGADSFPSTEEVWTVTEPLLPEPEPEPEPEEAEVEMEDGEIRENGEEKEPGPMKAWPPMSDATKKDLPKSKVKRDEQSGSKVWPPPQAPDYMKTVKDLPSGVRVMHDTPRGEPTERQEQNRGEEGHSRGGLLPHPQQGGLLPHPQGGKVGLLPHPNSQEGSANRQGLGKADRQGEGIVLVGRAPAPLIPGLGDIPTDSQQPMSVEGPSHGTEQVPSTPRPQEGPPSTPEGGYPPENEGSLSGKRRRTSGESYSQPMAKRPAILGLPVWEKELGEYDEEELAKGDNLRLPEGMLENPTGKGPNLDVTEIGRCGESIVHYYLERERDENPSVTYIHWCNETEEQGLPYDFEVGVETEEEKFTVYIEVKSTLSDTKEIFEISYPQVSFAQEKKNHFHVYRVFNANNPDLVRLVRIQNLADKINHKQVKLCLVI